MAGEIVKIYYPAPKGSLEVRRLSDYEQVTRDHAEANLRLQLAAYASYFEVPRSGLPHPLPRGSVARHFGPVTRRTINSRWDRMRGHMSEKGSQYLYIPHHEAELSWHGLLKATPSRLRKVTKEGPNCYWDDLIVAPASRHRGVVRSLAHAGLIGLGFKPDRELIFDLIAGSTDVRSRLLRYGMVPTDIPVNPLEVDGHQLPAVRYKPSRGLTLADLRINLETPLSNQWLKRALLVHTPEA